MILTAVPGYEFDPSPRCCRERKAKK